MAIKDHAYIQVNAGHVSNIAFVLVVYSQIFRVDHSRQIERIIQLTHTKNKHAIFFALLNEYPHSKNQHLNSRQENSL